MTTPNEYTLVEKPILDTLSGQYGYRTIHPAEHEGLRTRENEVLFEPLLIDALVRINDIPTATAKAVFNDLARIADQPEVPPEIRFDDGSQAPV